MKSKKKMLPVAALLLCGAWTLAGLMECSLASPLFAGEECTYHHGNHYARKNPTASESGFQEFWACCVCNHQYLIEPNGEWTDLPASEMSGGLGADHIAYLAPLEAQELHLYKTSYELSVGDKATIQTDETADLLSSFGTLSYASSDPSVVSVTYNGILTAKALGEATVSISGAVNGFASVSVSVTENARNLGFDFALSDEIDSYDGVVKNREELNHAMSEMALAHHQYAKFHVSLSESISDEDFSGFYEMRDLTPGYLWSDRILPIDTWGSLTGSEYYAELPTGEYDVYVSFCYVSQAGYSPASETMPVNGREVTELPNALSAIRRNENESKPGTARRSAAFLDFPMYQTNTNGYRDVYNSEELWWTVANGYIPRFPLSHSSAEEIFERAKDILRNEITNDMDDGTKMLALYDYVSEWTRYDYEALECETWLNDTAWYLEGPFFEGRCVCDSFSRLYSLLCNMEGIGVERGCGYSSSGGHAWNYAPYHGDWYLTCTTWSQANFSSSTYSTYASFMNVNTPYFEVTNYATFLADLLYMETNSGYSRDYMDSIHDSHLSTKSVSFADVASFGDGYNFRIGSKAEAEALASAVYDARLTSFYVPYLDEGSYIASSFGSALLSEGYSEVSTMSFAMSDVNYYLVNASL